MIMPQAGRLIAALAAILILTLPSAVQAGQFSGGIGDTFGPCFGADPHQAPRVPIDPRRRPRPAFDSAGMVQHWNEIAIDATGLDHTPVAPGESRVFGEQLGPARASRAMAIIHLAIFDAVNAIEGEYKSYTGVGHAPFGTSMKAAIAQAAHDTLVALFPSQTPSFADQLADDLTEIPDGRLKTNGVALGRRTAAAILTARANDGSQRPEPRVGIEFLTSNEPGKWRQDPISMIPLALGAYWGEVKPFALETSEQFRVPQPPRLDSPEYTAAFNEVKAVGGDGVVRRQKPHQASRNSHEEDRPGQRIASSQRIAPIAEQHCAEGPCEKPDGKDSEGGNQRQRRVRGGKEEDSKHGCEVAVEGEVIPFQHVADRAGEERFLHH